MPDDKTPAAPAADPFDLGDTELYPKLEVAPHQAPSPASADASPAGTPEPTPESPSPPRPRNPDGTFAKAGPDPATHPDWLVKLAREFNLDDDEIAELPTPTLSRQVHRLQRERVERYQSHATERLLVDPQGATASAPAGLPAAEPEIDWGKDDEGNPYSEKDYAALAPIVRQLEGMIRAQGRKIAALEGRVGAVHGHIVRQAQESRDAYLDRVVLEHADPAHVGTGGVRACKDAERRKRFNLIRTAMELAGPNATDEQVAAQVGAAAAESGWAKKKAEPEPRPAPKGRNGYSAEEWNGSGVARPTQLSGAKEPPGEEVAAQNLKRRMDAAGIGDGDVMDGLLG